MPRLVDVYVSGLLDEIGNKLCEQNQDYRAMTLTQVNALAPNLWANVRATRREREGMLHFKGGRGPNQPRNGNQVHRKRKGRKGKERKEEKKAKRLTGRGSKGKPRSARQVSKHKHLATKTAERGKVGSYATRDTGAAKMAGTQRNSVLALLWQVTRGTGTAAAGADCL
jgi:hypothetical protein